jgi:hypothetical protein
MQHLKVQAASVLEILGKKFDSDWRLSTPKLKYFASAANVSFPPIVVGAFCDCNNFSNYRRIATHWFPFIIAQRLGISVCSTAVCLCMGVWCSQNSVCPIPP